MAVRRLVILWSLVLSSLAEDTLPHGSPGQWKTPDVSMDQISRIQKTNNVDLHDDSNPPTRTIVQISDGKEDITSPNRRITELAHNLNNSIMEAQELEPKQGGHFWIWMPQGPSESILFGPGPNMTPEHPFPLSGTEQDALDDYSRRPSDPGFSTNINHLFLRNPFHGEMFSANAQSPGYTNTDISNVQSPRSSSSDADLRKSDFLSEVASAALGNNINDKEELIETIPLPVVGNQASNLVKNFVKNEHFVRRGNHLQSSSLDWPVYDNDHNEHNRLDQKLDGVGTGFSEENEPFGSDFEGMSTLEENMKRKFDSISGISSFGRFGKREDKRRFDSISGISSLGRFGKREDKRKFDSISGISSFGRFGKREDKRKFDSISGISSFGRFGKREDKRKFDSISGISSFGRFGKRQVKRNFDSISGISSFGRFGKREDKRKFDSISGISSFGGFGKREDKRKFDSISGISSFGRFGKRQVKSKFDSISGISSFGRFGKRENKRKFDSISGISSFGGFGKRQDKRKFDSISDISSFSTFGKRQDKRKFDSISDSSSFGGFGRRSDKRVFYPISEGISLGRRNKRAIPEDRKFGYTLGNLQMFGNRKFDSISRSTSFKNVVKRQVSDKENLSTPAIGAFDAIDKSLDDYNNLRDYYSLRGDKRRFDSISRTSSFGSFGKRQEQEIKHLDAISQGGKSESFDNRKLDSKQELGFFGESGTKDKQPRRQVGTVSVASSFGRNENEEKITFDSISHGNHVGRLPKQQTDDRTVESFSGYNPLGKYAAENRGLYFYPDVIPFQNVRLNTARALVTSKFNSKYNQQSIKDVSKRRFDRISTQGNVFRSFGKRFHRNVNALSKFDELQKRHFDRISGTSRFGRLGKRAFDIYKYSSPGGFGRNIFNTPDTAVVNWWGERQHRDIPNGDLFSGFSNGNTVYLRSTAKRRSDSIDHGSAFQIFAKKESVTDTSIVPELDNIVIFKNNHPFPELPRQTRELLILDSLPRAAPDNVEDFFLVPRVEDGQADSVGYPGIMRSSDNHRSGRWS